jgi:hypothetical protein
MWFFIAPVPPCTTAAGQYDVIQALSGQPQTRLIFESPSGSQRLTLRDIGDPWPPGILTSQDFALLLAVLLEKY